MKPSVLRDGFASALLSIDGLTVSTTAVSNLQPPHAVVAMPRGEYDATMGRGSDTLTLQVVIYVGRADDAAAFDLLDDFVAGSGDRSIKTVLEQSDETGLTTAMVRVRSYEIGSASSTDGSELLAATFEIEVVAPGSE